jgi:hypothetical protein
LSIGERSIASAWIEVPEPAARLSHRLHSAVLAADV